MNKDTDTDTDTDYQQRLEKVEYITKELTSLRKKTLISCKDKFPDLKYKTYSGLCSGIKANNVDKKIIMFTKKNIDYINQKKEEIVSLQEEVVVILDEISKEYRKRVTKLDPLIDIIPKDTYPKFSDCDIYPKRQSCNHGSTENSDWDRCEFMKYDNSKSIYDSNRWECIYI